MKVKTVSGTDLFQMFFPGIGGYLKSPDTPFQYSQQLKFTGDIKRIHDQMIRICIWCRENLDNEKLWYINANGYLYEQSSDEITFTFDFANDIDLMAFKLKWC